MTEEQITDAEYNQMFEALNRIDTIVDGVLAEVRQRIDERATVARESSPCNCLCDSCKLPDECHYSSYHCKHWVRSYGDVEGYGLCLIQVLMDRPNFGWGHDAEKFHDQYMSERLSWYKPPTRR